jgi:hypothetical protein
MSYTVNPATMVLIVWVGSLVSASEVPGTDK